MPHPNSLRLAPANTSSINQDLNEAPRRSALDHQQVADHHQTHGTDNGISTVEFNEPLSQVGPISAPSYIISTPLHQYQQSPPRTYISQYQQYPVSQSPTTYNSPGVESAV